MGKSIAAPRQNALFRGGNNGMLNACVGSNGGPYGYSAYAEGYFVAAERLMESLSESNRSIDILVCPIAFNFRQGIELWMKHFSCILPRIWNEPAPTRFTHFLQDNWDAVREYLLRDAQFDPEGDLVPKIDELVREFVDIDPRGEVFRYPEAKGGQQHLLGSGLVNIEVLYEALREARTIFEWWDISSGYLWDVKCEMWCQASP